MEKVGKIVLAGGLLGAVLLGGCGPSAEEVTARITMRLTGMNMSCVKALYLEKDAKVRDKNLDKLIRSPMDKPLGGIEPVFMPTWVRNQVHSLGWMESENRAEYTFHNGNVYVPRIFIDYPQDKYKVIYDVELYDDKYEVLRVQAKFSTGVNSDFKTKTKAIFEGERGKTYPYSHNKYIKMVAEDIGVIERKAEKNA